MKELKVSGSIWPDADGEVEVNKFLKKFGVSLKFLLDDGLLFRYEEGLDVYSTNGSVYFRDASTKATILHYYEDFDKIVFEDRDGDQKYEIPIYDELNEFL